MLRRRRLRSSPSCAARRRAAPRAAGAPVLAPRGRARLPRGRARGRVASTRRAACGSAPAPRPLFDPEAPNAWCVARDARGVLYVGTGNEGRVVRVDGHEGLGPLRRRGARGARGRGRARRARLRRHLARRRGLRDRRRRARPRASSTPPRSTSGRSPSTTRARSTSRRAARAASTACSATEVATTLLASTETHILSLAVDAATGASTPAARPRASSTGSTRPGRPFVVLDSAFREIKALDVGDDGALYAAAIDGRTAESTPRPPPAPPQPAAAPARSWPR